LELDYELLCEQANNFEALYKESLNKIKELEKGCAVCYRPHDEHVLALQEFCNKNIDKSKVASMIYGIGKNNKVGIGYSYGNTYGESSSSASTKGMSPPHLYSSFVYESAQSKAMKFAKSITLKTSHLSN
jgi:hypothetical protein